MKTSITFSLLLVLAFFGSQNSFAVQDSVFVKPVHSSFIPCAFNFTIKNANAAGKNIDGLRFDLVTTISSGGLIQEYFKTPSTWSENSIADLDPTHELTASSINAGIIPGASLSGFILAYDNAFDEPVTIHWVALNAGVGLDSGEVTLVCTQFQSYDKTDVVSVVTSKSGPDPCFSFTLINQNAPNFADIQSFSIELLGGIGGQMRPSKITPAAGWILDSVTSTAAFFHTDNPLSSNGVASPFTICLRANISATKFSFVWRANNTTDAISLIDRDTLFNVANTATGAPTDADSVTIAKPNGCLYTATLKNFHVANPPLAPSRIVRFAIYSKTPGVTFEAAPSAPFKWTKKITANKDTVIYTSDSLVRGIPSGTTAQFSFSLAGPTTNFNLGWESDQAASPFPPKYSVVSTGTVSGLNCAAPVPASDSAFFSSGSTECNFKLTVKNTHNTPHPQSNIKQVTISIPTGSGQLTPTGNSATPVWDFANINATSIKFFPQGTDPGMIPDPTASQDMTFSLAPTTPGQDITATWTTIDENGFTTGTGTGTIKCTPTVIICDTFYYHGIEGSGNRDSCRQNMFVLRNRKTVNITSLTISITNGWLIDSIGSTLPAGWTAIGFTPRSLSATFQSEGLHPQDSSIFFLKFYGCFPHETILAGKADTFSIVATTTDVNSKICSDISTINLCKALICDLGGVESHSDYTGVRNFTIHPNPARSTAEITFDVNTQSRIAISVLDELGHNVADISNKVMGIGSYHIPCVLNNLPDGVYYIRMQTSLGVMTRKLILTK